MGRRGGGLRAAALWTIAEALESRRLLAAGPDPLRPDDTAWPAALPDDKARDLVRVRCDGVEAQATPGRVLRLDPQGKAAASNALLAPDQRRRALERMLRSRRPAVRVQTRLETANLAVIEAPRQLTYAQLVRSFRMLPGFRYLEPDVAAQVDSVSEPSDPRFATMWQLHNTGQTGGTPGADIDAPPPGRRWARRRASRSWWSSWILGS
jgi:hypothetical protein